MLLSKLEKRALKDDWNGINPKDPVNYKSVARYRLREKKEKLRRTVLIVRAYDPDFLNDLVLPDWVEKKKEKTDGDEKDEV
jgi:hypothetical protein